ncbi:MAG TPA: hypothetical protein VF729_03930 [Solirubrobacterales bacterium]
MSPIVPILFGAAALFGGALVGYLTASGSAETPAGAVKAPKQHTVPVRELSLRGTPPPLRAAPAESPSTAVSEAAAETAEAPVEAASGEAIAAPPAAAPPPAPPSEGDSGSGGGSGGGFGSPITAAD